MKAIGYGLVFLILSCCSVAYSQSSRAGATDIAFKLKSYNKQHITEKVYLQFDKPYYAAGDTLYFKAYVTMDERHDLSTISGVLHVELINTANKIDKNIKLQLVNGTAWGDFALPDSLPQGNYRVRAYTRWMQNEGNDSFFEKTIPVGALYPAKVSESNTARIRPQQARADLQFFPEGGELVTGMNNKVAFKAIGTNGLGIDVKGIITDNSGKEITGFASTHLGMGSFELNPESGKTYKATLAYADGSKDELQLPQANNKGITLSINNDSIAKASVKIEANADYYQENKGKTYQLLIYSGGYATTVNYKLDSPVIAMDIIKRKLFTGIATVTLFSQNNEPIAERLIFIQNYDQLNLKISADKAGYTAREKVNLKITATTRADSATTGTFSVSVTDENKVPQDENNETTILSTLLLTSDLKGHIEQPNYYFANNEDLTPNTEKQKELDLVMLTHGYRGFTWKQITGGDSTQKVYQPETAITISGIAKNLVGTPLQKADVSLIAVVAKTYSSTTTDEKGRFTFIGLNFTDTAKFILQAVNAKGKNNTQLVYQQDKPAPITSQPQTGLNNDPAFAAYLDNDAKQQQEVIKMGLVKAHALKEVKIKAFKEDNNYPTQSFAGAGHADQVIRSDEILKGGGELSSRLIGKTKGLIWKPRKNGGFFPTVPGTSQPVVIVLDGNIGADMDQLPVSSIGTIEILLGANAGVYGTSSAAIIITSKYGVDPKDIQSKGILPITIQGYYKAREFYSPKYEASDPPNNHPDLRSTIYWKPNIITDKDGAASIDFYNADGKGTYKVIVEGIDSKGNIGRQVFHYQVD